MAPLRLASALFLILGGMCTTLAFDHQSGGITVMAMICLVIGFGIQRSVEKKAYQLGAEDTAEGFELFQKWDSKRD